MLRWTNFLAPVRRAMSWRRDVDEHLRRELGELPPGQQERYYKRATADVLGGKAAEAGGYVAWTLCIWLIGGTVVLGLIGAALALNRRAPGGGLHPWLLRTVLFVAGIGVLTKLHAVILGHYVRRRLWALVPRLCPSCGYDLRATPGRCPECGLVPAAPPTTPTSRGNDQ